MIECVFSNNKCKPRNDKRINKLYNDDIIKFFNSVCSYCIKNKYARAKDRLSKKHYTVVNTL